MMTYAFDAENEDEFVRIPRSDFENSVMVHVETWEKIWTLV